MGAILTPTLCVGEEKGESPFLFENNVKIGLNPRPGL